MMRLLACLSLMWGLQMIPVAQVIDTPCNPQDRAQSQLVAGIDSEIVADAPVKLLAEPSADAALVAQLPPGTILYLTGGPQCSGGNIWWQGKFNLETASPGANFGWLTEFDGEMRQLNPRIPTLNPTLPRQSPPITAANLAQLISQVEMGPLGDVQDFVWSPDSQYLAINTLRAVWVYHATAAQPKTLPIHLPRVAFDFWNTIGAVAFSPDSQTIATVDIANGDLHRWSLTGSEESVQHIGVEDYAGIAAIAPDFSRWAIAHGGGSITVWDAQTGSKLQTLKGHTVVGGLAFTPDGTRLISMGSFPYISESLKDNTVRLWDTASGQALAVETVSLPPAGMTGGKSRIAVSADGKTAALFAYSAKQDNVFTTTLYLMDIASAAFREPLVLTDGLAQNTAFSSDGSILAVNFLTSIVFVDVKTGKHIAQLPFEQDVQAISFSPDGRWLVVARADDAFNKSIIEFWGVR